MAAPSKFTPEIRGALIERFAAGCSIPDAASAVGVNEKTVKQWLTRGRKEDAGEYAEFAAEADEVREKAKERIAQPMDEDELARVVSDCARRGNTTAMKLRWDMLTAKKEPPEQEKPADPLANLDELAARRAARA